MIPTNILVPIDFSPCAEHALDYACALAGKLGARIHLVNAIATTLPELSIALTDQMISTWRVNNAALLDKLVADRRSLATFGEVMVIDDDARDAIVKAARSVRADLIIIGTHGRRGISRMLLGSVAEDVVRRAPCPVLAVRQEPKS
ncbi:MAG: universal stress protein [Deltaproteobacteria bacterium]|nr:MAG: universal stress protein [Deltaproteobacteria bacterium]TMQ22603.1 MAG: universal stress protein [Deltaproteobacteria bacterium]